MRTIFFLLLLPVSLWAQDGYNAYNRGYLGQALNYLQSGNGSPIEIDFLRAAMTVDADSAVEIYRRIALEGPDSEIGKRAQDRVRQYYFAMGLYNRAEELGRSLGDWELPERRLRAPESTPPPPFVLSPAVLTRPEVPEPKKEEPEEVPAGRYALQVGAFSSRSNAERLKVELEEAGYDVDILEPSENPTNLYMLRVVGYATIEAAFAAAPKLESEFGVKPIVVTAEVRN